MRRRFLEQLEGVSEKMSSFGTSGDPFGNTLPRSLRRQGLAILVAQLDCLLDDSAKFSKDLLLIVAVTAAVKQTGRSADVATILFGPLDNFHVSITISHDFDSLMARFTSLS
jgi:hypothetical protein